MIRSPALRSLQLSLLAAAGVAACRGNVVGEGTGTGTGGGGGKTTTGLCTGAVPVPTTGGGDSGFARCPDGTVHRVQPVTCSTTAGITACTGTEMQITCKGDADCTMSPHGRCASTTQQNFGGNITTCGCVYPCANDAECSAGQVCVCAGVVPSNQTWSACAPAACTTGADCATGECGISSYQNGCGYDVELACRAPTDACRLDAQCTSMLTPHCVLMQGSPGWSCAGMSCAIGRPLLIDGAPRTAPATERRDWQAPAVSPALDGLDAGTCAALAGHWLEVAALEHASVASFARFSLELLALGAPPGLLEGAQRAGADEIEHARLAYGLASAYGGRAAGPGPLDLRAVTLRSDVRAVLCSLVVEGCVGETLGVAEALALGERAGDPALRAVHARLVADETRHAELSWRALAWLLRGAGADLADFAERCFEEGTAALSADPPARPAVAPEHGLLSAAEIGGIRRQALRDVVAPCAAALLAEVRREAPAPLEASAA